MRKKKSITLMSLKQCLSSFRLIMRSIFFPIYSESFKKTVLVSSSVSGLIFYCNALCVLKGKTGTVVADCIVEFVRLVFESNPNRAICSLRLELCIWPRKLSNFHEIKQHVGMGLASSLVKKFDGWRCSLYVVGQ